MRIAYVTADSCGVGHAMRGIALVQAAERSDGAGPESRTLTFAGFGPVPSTDWGSPADGASPEIRTPTVHVLSVVPPTDWASDASRPIIDLRAFGPVVAPLSGLPRDTHRAPVDLEGYEGSNDWHHRVLQWQPDLLLGDLRPSALDLLRVQLGCPSWLLMRIWPGEWRGAPLWSRVVAIEPGAAEMLGIGVSDVIPPIVGRQRIEPEAGTELHAGYSTFWEAQWYGYADRVRWIADGNPERQARIAAGGTIAENGADVLVDMALDTPRSASVDSRHVQHNRSC